MRCSTKKTAWSARACLRAFYLPASFLLAPELCVEKSVLDAVDARVKAWFETHDTLTLGEFRDALGTSRDHALLVLEYYDRRGILRREGDVRRPGAQFGEIEK